MLDLYGEELLNAGIVLLVMLLIAAAIFSVYFCLSGKRLKKRLENEYGKKSR